MPAGECEPAPPEERCRRATWAGKRDRGHLRQGSAGLLLGKSLAVINATEGEASETAAHWGKWPPLGTLPAAIALRYVPPIACGSTARARSSLMPRRFPVSDHCDGQHFFNPGATGRGRGLLQVLRWRMREERAAWPDSVTDPTFPPPPDQVGDGEVAITFINQASFLIRFPGVVVLTDPIFSLRCSPVTWAGPMRVRPPGISLASLPRPDVVLLSHNHYDHMDLPSLRVLQRSHAAAVRDHTRQRANPVQAWHRCD